MSTIGLLAGLLLAGGLVGAFMAGGSGDDATASASAASAAEPAEQQSETIAVSESGQEDPDAIEQRLDAWIADHPDADVASMERAYDADGNWVGYEITYS